MWKEIRQLLEVLNIIYDNKKEGSRFAWLITIITPGVILIVVDSELLSIIGILYIILLTLIRALYLARIL